MNIKNCTTCRYYLSEPPHTCDMCTSLDNTEDYSGWTERIIETSQNWVETREQLPENNGIYQVTICDLKTRRLFTRVLYWDETHFKLLTRKDAPEDWYPQAYCLLKEPYRK